jgi:pimeloyl-ACP methyl ester carboxylesterase
MKPLLLLIPGMLNDARIWAAVAPALADRAETCVADVTRGESIAAMAEAAWRQLAGLAPERPLVIAGYSMGGYVALQMLAAPARPVQALALLASSARPESPEGAALREKTIAAIGRDFPRVVDGILAFGAHAGFDGRAARAMMIDVGAEAAIRQNRAVLGRADQRASAQALRLPTLVMVGADDRITPPALAEELAGLIPDARRVVVPDCGHLLPLERPAAVIAALRELPALTAPKET